MTEFNTLYNRMMGNLLNAKDKARCLEMLKERSIMKCDKCGKSQPLKVEWYEIKEKGKIVLLCPDCIKGKMHEK